MTQRGVADGTLSAGGFGQRQVCLDLVAVAAAVLLLDDVAGLGKVGDNAISALPRAETTLAMLAGCFEVLVIDAEVFDRVFADVVAWNSEGDIVFGGGAPTVLPPGPRYRCGHLTVTGRRRGARPTALAGW